VERKNGQAPGEFQVGGFRGACDTGTMNDLNGAAARFMPSPARKRSADARQGH
jgi:hypothetical protein